MLQSSSLYIYYGFNRACSHLYKFPPIHMSTEQTVTDCYIFLNFSVISCSKKVLILTCSNSFSLHVQIQRNIFVHLLFTEIPVVNKPLEYHVLMSLP